MARVSTDTAVIDEPPVIPAEESKPQGEKTGFFQYISELTAADWEIHIAYVYRIAPITDRLAAGLPKKYITKYSTRFDEDTLKIEHGSGRYRIQLNKLDAKGHSKTIKTIEVDIEDPKFPPNVPEGQWMEDSRNDRWSWARKKKAEPEAPAATPTQDTWTPERVMNMVERLRPQEKKEDQISITREVLNAVKETRAELGAANSPASMIDMLKNLILIARPAAPEKPAGPAEDSAIVKLLMLQLEASREDAKLARAAAEAERQRNHELQLKMLEAKATATDPMDMVEKVLNLKERLGGDDDHRNWKEKLVDEGMQHVPKLIDLASRAIGYQRADPPRPQQQPRPPQNQPNSQQTQTPQPTPATAGETMPEQPKLDPDVEWLANYLAAHGRMVTNFFRNNPNGHDFADSFIVFTNEAIFQKVQLIGPVKIMQAIQLLPEMYADLVGNPPSPAGIQGLEKFIIEFTEGPEEDDEEENDRRDEFPEAARAPVPIGKQAKKAKK